MDGAWEAPEVMEAFFEGLGNTEPAEALGAPPALGLVMEDILTTKIQSEK